MGWGVPEWPWGAMKGLVPGGSPRTWCLPAWDGRWTAARMMQRVRMTRMMRVERTRIWLARTKRRDRWKSLRRGGVGGDEKEEGEGREDTRRREVVSE